MNRLLVLLLTLAAIGAFAWVSASCDDDDDDNDDDDTGGDDDDDNDDDDTAGDDDNDDDTFGEIAFIDQTGGAMKLAVIDAPLATPTILVDVANRITIYPAFSPDGQTIAFASNLHDTNPGINFATMLYTIPAAGGEPQRLTADDWTTVTESTPVYAPDGARLAYTRSDSVNEPMYVDRIWFASADGSDLYPLYTDTESRNDVDPAFSPDGTKLAYFSDGDEYCGDIYLADLTADPVTRERLTTSDPIDVQLNQGPFFDATGAWVYFESARNGGVGLYRVAVTGGEPELVVEFGYTDEGPYAGMYAYSQIRPTPDRLALVGVGAADGTDRLYLWPTLDPLADPVVLTAASLDAVDPDWWRPAAR